MVLRLTGMMIKATRSSPFPFIDPRNPSRWANAMDLRAPFPFGTQMPIIILNIIILFVITNRLAGIHASTSANANDNVVAVETIETITFEDFTGVQHEEYAFRAPISGVPANIIRMYCANVKLRLYWNVFRDEVKNPQRKGIYLRRMARFAKHIYPDIRSVDKPFNATRLSIIDEYFAIKDPLDEPAGDVNDDGQDVTPKIASTATASNNENSKSKGGGLVSKLTRKLSGKFRHQHNRDNSNEADKDRDVELELELDSLEQNKEAIASATTSLAPNDTIKQFKRFVKRYAAKFGMGIYTRWRTMWWLMMPCLFAKYYLWDPALDEFIKLQRNLVMYPDFQTTKLQDIDCKPIKLFQHILDVCKILNPLMRIDFGQFSLDKMTRFKKDT